MAKCTLDRQQAVGGQLPRVCMCCGMPAQTRENYAFRYTPFWMLLFNIMPSRVTFHSFTIIDVPAPLCYAHQKRLWLPFKVKMAAIITFLIGFVIAAALFWTIIVPFIVIPLIIPTMMILMMVAFYLEVNTPRLAGVTQKTLRFESVSDAFAQQATPRVAGWPQPEPDGSQKTVALAIVGGLGSMGALVVTLAMCGCGMVMVPAMGNFFNKGNAKPPAIVQNQNAQNNQANNRNVQPENPDRPAQAEREPNGNTNPIVPVAPVYSPMTVTNATEAAAAILASDERDRKLGFRWLHSHRPEASVDKTPVAQALNNTLEEHPDATLKAVRFGWFTSENSDLALQALNDALGDPFRKGEIGPSLIGLGELQDERFVSPLISALKDFRLRGQAKNALMAIGQSAVSETAPLLLSSDLNVRKAASEVLTSAEADPQVILNAVLPGLSDEDASQKIIAADVIAGIEPVEDRRTEVSQLLEPLALSAEKRERDAGIKALKVWLAPESVARLLPLFDSKNAFFLHGIFPMFAKTGEPLAAQTIAAQLPNFHVRRQAADALKSMGPVAEEPVAELIGRNDFGLANDVVTLMNEIGTKRSVAKVRAAMAAAEKAKNRRMYDKYQALLTTISEREPPADAVVAGDAPTETITTEPRTWTDSTGQFKIEAAFIDVLSGEARLKREDGEITAIPLSRLSLADQKLIREILAKRRAER